MGTIVLRNIKISELPETWRNHLTASEAIRFTIRIEEEQSNVESSNDQLFGMWCDREDMANVDAYMRSLRASRF